MTSTEMSQEHQPPKEGEEVQAETEEEVAEEKEKKETAGNPRLRHTQMQDLR